MKEKLKEQKGITLIALIITIIVMLILAGVSINIIQNQGLITKSKDAADRYNEKAGEEQANLTEWERLMAEYSGSSEEAYVTPRTEVEYKGQTLKVGDYVNYDEGTGYTWTTDSTKGTGGDGNLTSKTYTTEDMSWRVLGLDENGNLELISDKQTSEYLYLKGKAGYYNGEEQLKEMCDALYGKGTKALSARSVTDDDINAILGYNKKGFSGEAIGCQELLKIRYGWKITYYATKTTWEPKDTFIMEDGSNEYIRTECYNGRFTDIDGTVATNENPITIESSAYTYTRDEFTERVNSDILNMVFDLENLGCHGAGSQFWLASRFVYGDYGGADWGLFNISDGILNGYDLYDSDGNESSSSYYVRPVVSLKSDVQLSGSSEAGWTIN